MNETAPMSQITLQCLHGLVAGGVCLDCLRSVAAASPYCGADVIRVPENGCDVKTLTEAA